MAQRNKWRDFSLPLKHVVDGSSAQIQEIGGKWVRITIGPNGSIVVQSSEVTSFLVSLQAENGKILHDATTHHGLVTIAAHRTRRAQDRGAQYFEFLEIPSTDG